MIEVHNSYAHGKLLITSEYLVIHGALSLSLPVVYGQHLRAVSGNGTNVLQWTAKERGEVWFQGTFSLPGLEVLETSDMEISNPLVHMLRVACNLNPEFLVKSSGYEITTNLDFDRNWGLGSSSTLTALLAGLAGIDAMQFHRQVSSGSGYDVACAQASGPILFQVEKNDYSIQNSTFNPGFIDQLFLVYLGRKQNSSREVAAFLRHDPGQFSREIDEISSLTLKIEKCGSLSEFQALIEQHEMLISGILKQQTVKEQYFSDFNGAVKSLGAWGGDFVLVASADTEKNIRRYFFEKGLEVVLPLAQMVYGLNVEPDNKITSHAK